MGLWGGDSIRFLGFWGRDFFVICVVFLRERERERDVVFLIF